MVFRYKIEITPRAYTDLNRIEKSILDASLSIASADRWANMILAKIYDLDMFPMRNPNTIKSKNMELWHVTVKHKYTIHYQILTRQRTIKIRRILPSNADVGKIKL